MRAAPECAGRRFEDAPTWSASAIGDARPPQCLGALFRARVASSGPAAAYTEYSPERRDWVDRSWNEVAARVAAIQAALAREGAAVGDRIAILLRNGVWWVCVDQAALGLGQVPVPLYVGDTPGDIAYVLEDSAARLLVVERANDWQAIAQRCRGLPDLERVLVLEPAQGTDDPLVGGAFEFPSAATDELRSHSADPDALATLVYTSGTTGRPKGVMLTHRNILSSVNAQLAAAPAGADDVFLSVLPLPHIFERVAGYYLPMAAGARVAYARSMARFAEDLQAVRPTVVLSVPRIYEQVCRAIRRRASASRLSARLLDWTASAGWRRFLAAQNRGPAPSLVERAAWPALRRLVVAPTMGRFGGRLRLAVSGGAPLREDVARFLLGLGFPLVEGYGLTEAASAVSTHRQGDVQPGTVGPALPGVEVLIGAEDELLVRGPNVMRGYWRRPDDTRRAIDEQGWLHTGDRATWRDGHLAIRGRLKEIIVMSTGEKVAPADLEAAIATDVLFEQAVVIGEGRPCLVGLLVLNREAWRAWASSHAADPEAPEFLESGAAARLVLRRLRKLLAGFPASAQIRAAWLTLEPWTLDGGLLTVTQKVKRQAVAQRFAAQIDRLYARR